MNVQQEEKKVPGLDDDDKSKTFKLIDKDGNTVEVSRNFAKISKLLETTLSAEDCDEIEINTVEPKILKLVIDYLEYHEGVEPSKIRQPLSSTEMKDVCEDSWDADFIDEIGKDLDTLFAVIMAANYFDIGSLLHLGSAKVASLIKGKPLDEIKEILSVNSKSSTTVEEKKE